MRIGNKRSGKSIFMGSFMALMLGLNATVTLAAEDVSDILPEGATVEETDSTATVDEGDRIMTVGMDHDFEAGQQILVEDDDDNLVLVTVEKVSRTRVLLSDGSTANISDGATYHVVEEEADTAEEEAVEETAPEVEEPTTEETQTPAEENTDEEIAVPEVEAPVEEPVEAPVEEETAAEEAEAGDAAYLSSYADISGSIEEFTGSINGGSNVLELTTANHDFEVGHGIFIEGAGSDYSMNNWLRTTVTAVNGSQLTLAQNASGGVGNAEVHHDDTEAVQAAISTGEKTYYFDIDEMNIKGLQLESNTTYDGMNRCTMYIPMAYSAVPYVQFMITTENENDVTIKDFIIDGNHDRGLYGDIYVGVAMVYITDSEGVTIEGNTMQNSGYLAVNIRGTASDILVEDNTILDTDTGVLAMPEWGGVLELDNLTCIDNYIEGGTSEGINVLAGLWGNLGTANNILIDGNTIKDKNGAAMQLGIRTSDITVSNNDISGSNHGILTMDMTYEDASLLTADTINIVGNKIYDNSWHNIKIDGSNIYFANNEIGKSVDGTNFGVNAASNVTIENNDFYEASYTVGIYNVDTAYISGNTFGNGSDGVNILGNASNIQNDGIELVSAANE